MYSRLLKKNLCFTENTKTFPEAFISARLLECYSSASNNQFFIEYKMLHTELIKRSHKNNNLLAIFIAENTQSFKTLFLA